MITKLATHDDIENIKDLFGGYSDEALKKSGILMDRTRAWEAIEYLVKNNLCYVGEYDNKVVAGLAGVIQYSLFTNDKFFASMFLYVEPVYRHMTKRFIDDVCDLLKTVNVTQLVVASPEFYESDKLDRFYKMSGFTLLERHYARKI